MSLRDLIYSQLSAEDNNNYDLDKLSEIESEVESENESENERESESDEDSIDSNGVGNRDSDDGRERDSAPEGGADSKSIRKRAIREKIANGGLNSKNPYNVVSVAPKHLSVKHNFYRKQPGVAPRNSYLPGHSNYLAFPQTGKILKVQVKMVRMAFHRCYYIKDYNGAAMALITLSKIDSLTRPEFVMFTEMLRYARLSEYADGTVTNPANTKTKLMKRLLKVCKGPLGNPDRKANPLYGGVLMRILMQVFLISDDMTTAKSYTQKRLQDKVFNKCLYLVSCNIVITVLEVIKIRADIESDLGLLLPSLQEIIDSPLKFYEYIMVIKKLLTVGNRKNPIYSKRTMYSKLLKDLSVSFSKIFKLKIAKDSSVEFHLLYVAFLYGNSELHKASEYILSVKDTIHKNFNDEKSPKNKELLATIFRAVIEFNCLFNGLHKEAFLHRSNLENIRVWVEHSDASMDSLYAAIRLNNLDLIDKKLLCSKVIECVESFPPSRIVKGNTPRDFTSSIDWDNAGYTHLHWVIWYQLIKFFKPLETFAQVYDPIPSNSDIAYRIPKRIKRRMEGCHSSEDCVKTESASERKSSDTYAIWIDEFKTNCSWWCSSILSSAALGNYIRCVYEYNAEELFQNFASTDQCTISQDSVSVDRILGHASTGNSNHKDNHITMRDSKYFDKLLTQRLMQSDESVDSSSSNADSGSSSSSTNSDEADSGSSSEDESEYEDGRSNKSKGSSSEDETSISNNGDSVPKGREEKGKPPSEKAFYTGDQLADSKSSPSEVIEIFSMPYRVFPNVEESVFNNASAAKKPSQSPTSNKTDFMLRLYQEVSGSSKSHFLVHSHKVEVLNPRQFKLGLMRADLMKEYDQVSIFSSKVLEILAFQAIISAHLYGQDNSFVLKVVQLLVFHAINLKKSFPIDTKNFTSDDKINLTNDDDSEEMNRRQDSYNSGPSDVDLYEIYMNAIATAEKCLCLLRYYNINLVRALRIANDMALNGDNDNLAPRKEVKQITTRLFSFEGDKLATYNPL